MRKLSVISFTVLFAVAWIGFFASDALAIPSFARKYGVNCNKCHTQIPQLSEDGIQFKQKGYRQPDEVGKLIWEEEIFPISALFKIRYNFTTPNKEGKPDKSFFDPHELELFSGGTMAPNISYFFDVEAKTPGSGKNDAKDEPFRINAFYVIFDDLLLDKNRINLKGGRIRNEYLHFSEHLKLTAEGYLCKCVTFVRDGIEINGLVPVGPGGLHYAGAVVNDQTGINNVDNNFRSPYGWASYTYKDQIIGVRAIYTPTKAGQDSTLPTENHTQFDTFFKLTFNEAIFDLGLSDINSSYLLFSFTTENDVNGETGVDRRSYIVEPTIFLGDKWNAVLRYELTDDPDKSGTNDRYLVSFGFHPVPNVKLFAEYMHTEKREDAAAKTREDRLRMGVFLAF